jgi:hypothetical protein
MTKSKINDASVRKMYEKAAARIEAALNTAVLETQDLPLGEAVAIVEQRLASIGTHLGSDKTGEAVEMLRRGEQFKLVFG